MKFNQKQKKTATLVGMFGLLALVLGMGGQTYAKYYTSNTHEGQSATVAKWGLVSNLKDSTLGSAFSKTYNNESVETLGDHLVVAPGTSGSIEYTISGTAEVDASILFEVTNYEAITLKKDGAVVYTPIKWTVAVDLESAVEVTDFANFEKSFEYDANSNADHKIVLAWSWEFGDDVIDQTDEYDTILGQYANDEASLPAGYSAVKTMTYSVKASMTQVKK